MAPANGDCDQEQLRERDCDGECDGRHATAAAMPPRPVRVGATNPWKGKPRQPYRLVADRTAVSAPVTVTATRTDCRTVPATAPATATARRARTRTAAELGKARREGELPSGWRSHSLQATRIAYEARLTADIKLKGPPAGPFLCCPVKVRGDRIFLLCVGRGRARKGVRLWSTTSGSEKPTDPSSTRSVARR